MAMLNISVKYIIYKIPSRHLNKFSIINIVTMRNIHAILMIMVSD